MKNIAKTYPFQVFRHLIYLPILNYLDLIQDLKRKVKTQKIIELDELGIDKSKGVRYEAISYKKLKKILSYAKKKQFDNFLDIGCGLGRPLIVANQVGFKNLYGVDISDKLIKKCQINLDIKKIEADLSCTDVNSYELPRGKLCIFLFNPFGEERVKKIVKKFSERENETLILYHNPKHSNVFDSKHLIKKFIWNNFGLYEEKCFVYLIPPR